MADFAGIADRAGQLARNLPYGDQRRLEIARAPPAQSEQQDQAEHDRSRDADDHASSGG